MGISGDGRYGILSCKSSYVQDAWGDALMKARYRLNALWYAGLSHVLGHVFDASGKVVWWLICDASGLPLSLTLR